MTYFFFWNSQLVVVLDIWDRCIYESAQKGLDVSAAFEDLSLCAQYFSFDVPEDPVERKTKSSNMGKEVNTPVLLQHHVSLEWVKLKKIAFLGPSTMLKLPLELFPIPTNFQKHVWPIDKQVFGDSPS